MFRKCEVLLKGMKFLEYISEQQIKYFMTEIEKAPEGIHSFFKVDGSIFWNDVRNIGMQCGMTEPQAKKLFLELAGEEGYYFVPVESKDLYGAKRND